jgi:molybdopterin molybdotransferase
LISVEEARARVLATAPAPRTEIIMLGEAAGRTLTAPIAARRTQPPADMSAMDGYAVRFQDAASVGAALKVIGASPAGSPYVGTVGPGETVRIFTGGEVPDGADAIILQEDAARDGDDVAFSEAAILGRHIRRAGLDFVAGHSEIAAGTEISPRHLALAAGMNAVWARVARKPRVAILATGDEIKLPGDELGPGQIIGSSGLGIAAYVSNCGGEPLMLDVAADDQAALINAVRQASGADILVTLGGASVGDHDLVQGVLTKQGLEVEFWRIAMRPGKPLMFGALGPQLVLGLPGNPVSTMVCAILFLGPLIAKMLGRPITAPKSIRAQLGTPMKANDRREDYVRARFHQDDKQGYIVEPFEVQDSSMMSLYADANALIVRTPDAPAAAVGDAVTVLPLD